MWKLWRVGKVFGTELKLHGTWVVMLAIYAISGYLSGGSVHAMFTVAQALIVFGVVVLHELGHIAAYKHYGLRAQDIILTPLGGVARGVGQARNPGQEIAIAAAGPAVNVVLGGLAFAAVKMVPWTAFGTGAAPAFFAAQIFLYANIFLGLFNLLPALPMDGGRILRGALTTRLGFLKATQRAAQVARWTTGAMAVYAVVTGNVMLLLLAGAVFLMSYAELAQAHAAQAQTNPLFAIMRAFTSAGGAASFGGAPRGPSGPSGRGGAGIVDQFGNPVGAGPAGGGWSSAEHVQPTPDGRGWTVQSVRWLED